MSTNVGNTKIGKVFIGSTEIAKIYQGSTLLFENDKSVPAYGYTMNNYNTYLFGSNSTSGLVAEDVLCTLSSIRGTLGASGSKIKVSDSIHSDNPNDEYNYSSTSTFNGRKIYTYVWNWEDRIGVAIHVIEDAIIGSKCGQLEYAWTHGYHPSSVSSSSMIYGTYNCPRKSSIDKKFTRKGFK